MTTQKSRIVSLSELAEQATQGERITQKLTDGAQVELRVFVPTQPDILAVQRVWTRVVETAQTATSEAGIPKEKAAVAYEMGFAVLQACVRDEKCERIPDEGFVRLYSLLPYKSDTMLRAQELCGIPDEMFSIPPLDGVEAVAAVKAEAADMVQKVNRKARRAAAAKNKKKG